MAIGLIVTNITDKVIPDKSLSKASSPTILVAQFGDGYQQRIASGLNSIKESFTVTFNNRPKAEADDIEAFFRAKKGMTSFAFTYPDTNSTSAATAVTSGSPGSTINITLTSSTNNLDISPEATVTGQSVTVVSISGTALVLSGAINVAADTTLNFVNPNEREVKVICTSWSVTFSNSDHYNVSATFERVYEP